MEMWEQELRNELDQLTGKSQRRVLSQVEHADRPLLVMNGRRMLNLASNDYLGLAGDERLKRASADAVAHYGAGATASRLIVGNHPLYLEAERALTLWKKSEAGLILQSGYAANTGIIAALIGRSGTVYSDKLNHASIVDGIVLSRAEHLRYRHNDLSHLEALLKKTPAHKRKLIVTDTVFSMDGDMARLHDLVTLKQRYNAILMVDEAHGSGVFGPNGEGFVHALKLQDQVDVQMGTFSKALGCYGAYVTGSELLIDYLTNKMRSFIFSTALPPAVLGSIREAIRVVQEERSRRERLQETAADFRTALSSLGFDTCQSRSQIVPVRIGSNVRTVKFSQRLQEEGIAAIPVRPPTVPENEARIRFTVTALHKPDELTWAVGKIAALGKEFGVIE